MPRNVKVPQETKSAIRLKHINNLNHGMLAGESQDLLAAEYGLSDRTIRDYVKGVYIAEHTAPKEIRPEPESVIINNIRPTLADVDDAHDGRLVELVKAERESTKHKSEVSALSKRVRHLQGVIEMQETRLGFFEHLQSHKDIEKLVPLPEDPNEPQKEAIAIIQASDWHVGEFVHPEKVNYYNKYNPDIAEDSAKKFFTRSLQLIRSSRRNRTVNKLLIHLGGDMMTGHIHEELKEMTAFSPNEEALFAKHLIVSGLEMLTNHIENILVACSYGNHGRNHPEKKIGMGAENSYEWAMYHDLARHFDNNERIKFLIPRGDFGYVDIGKYKIRTTHMDAVRYMGGVGGISVPIIKAIHNWNSAQFADWTLGGHFHQRLINEQNGFMINNCLIGVSAYGLRFGRPTRASQNFSLIDLERGLTLSAPIFCDDGDRLEKKTSYPGIASRWVTSNVSQRSGVLIG